MHFSHIKDRQEVEDRAMYRLLGKSVLTGVLIGLGITGAVVSLGLAAPASIVGAAATMAGMFGTFGGIVGLSAVAAEMHLPAAQKEFQATEQKEAGRAAYVHALSQAERNMPEKKISGNFRHAAFPAAGEQTPAAVKKFKPLKLNF